IAIAIATVYEQMRLAGGGVLAEFHQRIDQIGHYEQFKVSNLRTLFAAISACIAFCLWFISFELFVPPIRKPPHVVLPAVQQVAAQDNVWPEYELALQDIGIVYERNGNVTGLDRVPAGLFKYALGGSQLTGEQRAFLTAHSGAIVHLRTAAQRSK